MYTYTHIYIFTKTQSLNLTLALQAHFLEWRLMRSGKELFVYCADVRLEKNKCISVLNLDLYIQVEQYITITCVNENQIHTKNLRLTHTTNSNDALLTAVQQTRL